MIVLLLLGCAEEEDSPPASTWVDNACGRWSGVQEGREWAYSWDDGAELTGEWTVEVGLFDGVNGRMTRSGSEAGPKLTRDYTDELQFLCEDGLWLQGVRSQYAGLDGGTPYSGETETVYDPPVQLWPAEATQGDRWDSVYAASTRTDGGAPVASAWVVRHEVLAPMVLQLGAGELRAFAVKQTTVSDDVPEGEATSVRTFVTPEIGVVKGQAWSLDAVR